MLHFIENILFVIKRRHNVLETTFYRLKESPKISKKKTLQIVIQEAITPIRISISRMFPWSSEQTPLLFLQPKAQSGRQLIAS